MRNVRYGTMILLLVLLVQCGLSSFPALQTTAKAANGATGPQVVGNHIVDAHGHPLYFTGVSDSGLEYTCNPSYQVQLQPNQFALMRSWGINTVRLPLSAPYWLNTNNSCPGYRAAVDRIIGAAETAGLYVIASLAWISPFNGGYSGGAGYPMVDRREGVAFWTSFASTYSRNDRMLFELYSEPHDVSWSIWRNGGTIVTTDQRDRRVPGTYTAIGMQELATLVHQYAPDRVALASGNEWGGDLTQAISSSALTGSNIAYSVHLYPGPNSASPTTWPSRFGNLAKAVPVIATEFGQLDCGHNFIDEAMAYLATATQGMVAWTWDTGDCGRPGILANYSGTPSTYGAVIKAYFLRRTTHA